MRGIDILTMSGEGGAGAGGGGVRRVNQSALGRKVNTDNTKARKVTIDTQQISSSKLKAINESSHIHYRPPTRAALSPIMVGISIHRNKSESSPSLSTIWSNLQNLRRSSSSSSLRSLEKLG